MKKYALVKPNIHRQIALTKVNYIVRLFADEGNLSNGTSACQSQYGCKNYKCK